MVRRAHPRIHHSVTDVSSLNRSVPNAVESGPSQLIVTSPNLVERWVRAYDARIAGHGLTKELEADAGTQIQEVRDQA